MFGDISAVSQNKSNSIFWKYYYGIDQAQDGLDHFIL